MALRSLSLCAGIGGLDLGVALAVPARTVCFVEREAFAAAVLVARMEDGSLAPAPVWSDLRNFGAHAWRGGIDLVCAGYPCQPFSLAGKRRGVDDPRHIWPHVARILEESGAPLAFFENVAGHVSLGLSDVLGDLAALGFDAEWTCLRASDVGAPHRRERLFILAHRDGGRQLLDVQLDGNSPSATADRCTCGRHADRRDSEVVHADVTRRTTTRGGHEIDAGGEPLARCGAMGDANGERLRLEPGRLDGSRRTCAPFPPGPSDIEGWRRWIEGGGPEPVIRRGTHGDAYRLDRLRSLGNAVVPQQAALAFRELAGRVLR